MLLDYIYIFNQLLSFYSHDNIIKKTYSSSLIFLNYILVYIILSDVLLLWISYVYIFYYVIPSDFVHIESSILFFSGYGDRRRIILSR